MIARSPNSNPLIVKYLTALVTFSSTSLGLLAEIVQIDSTTITATTDGPKIPSYQGDFGPEKTLDGLTVEGWQRSTNPSHPTRPAGHNGTHWTTEIFKPDANGDFTTTITYDLGSAYDLREIHILNTSNSAWNDRETDTFTIEISKDNGTVFSPPSRSLTLQDYTLGFQTYPIRARAVTNVRLTVKNLDEVNRNHEGPTAPNFAKDVAVGLNEVRFFSVAPKDTDKDQMADNWEISNFGDLSRDGTEDEDLPGPDGLTNLEEYQKKTDPKNADTDNDDLNDGDEVNIHQSDPLDDDSDDDSLKDGEEVKGAGKRPATNPTLADTDGDSLSDFVETNTGILISAEDTGTNPTIKLAEGWSFSASGPPPNDDFSNAQTLPKNMPVQAIGSLTDALDRFRATIEDDEPNHAGRKGNGSVWYSWTPDKDQRVKVIVNAANIDLLLAVYTGSALDDLVLVHRYENFAYPAFSRKRAEPFTKNARVEFMAKQGTTYYLAVGTENVAFEKFGLSITPSENNFKPVLSLLEPGSTWEYTLATDEAGNQVDPKSLDEDFYYTWMFPDRYDGPDFQTGRAPLGYGEIEGLHIKSNLLGSRRAQPSKQQRHTAYLRTTFTPVLDTKKIGIQGIIDDGAIIYLNGREVTRVNIDEKINPHDWKAMAENHQINNISSERYIHHIIVDNLNLPADVPVRLSLSLHNYLSTSSDLGLDLRIFMLEP